MGNSIFVEIRELIKKDPIGKMRQRLHKFGGFRHSSHAMILKSSQNSLDINACLQASDQGTK